ncbi:hypothetical protein BDN67DRAFT_177532 [Paxillus ammoniavirescens]|nr:hypothetical protein BDN67DRAFT_177532 [Paxillus ammoniavirescens]
MRPCGCGCRPSMTILTALGLNLPSAPGQVPVSSKNVVTKVLTNLNMNHTNNVVYNNEWNVFGKGVRHTAFPDVSSNQNRLCALEFQWAQNPNGETKQDYAFFGCGWDLLPSPPASGPAN